MSWNRRAPALCSLPLLTALGMGVLPASAQQSRISIAGERYAQRILVDGRSLLDVKAAMLIKIEQEWTSGPAAGLALATHYTGGMGCIATFRVIDLTGPSPLISKEFGECAASTDSFVGNDVVIFTFPGQIGTWTYSKKSGLAEMPRVSEAEHIAAGVAAYQAGDFVRALSHLWPVRHGRDPQAFYTLGLMVHLEKGVPRDYELARNFYSEAAERDLPVAFFRIGVLHANGRGVPKDMAEANRWYHKAADRGDGLGQYNLGLSILTGAGAKKDDPESLYWMILARERLLDPKDRAAAERNISILGGRLTPEQVRRIRASAATWKPMTVDPFADAPSLRAWIGFHPSTRFKGMTLLEGPRVRARLVTALGAERVPGLSALVVASSVNESAGWLIAGGCMPHDCGANQYVYGVNLSTFEVLACLTKSDPGSSGTTVIYGDSEGHRIERSASLTAGKCPKEVAAVPIIRAALAPPVPASPPIIAAKPPGTPPTAGGAATMMPPVLADPREAKKRSSSGSGFVVTTDGHILTNHHVVEGCHSLSVRRGQTSTPGRLVAAGAKNDLAVMTADLQGLSPLPFRDGRGIRPGDSVVAVGYTYAGLLSTTSQVTTGTVTSLAGIADDTRYLQISAPIQHGNSGGPLLDGGGTVTGIIVATLNALTVAKATGSLPQNVNFAIKSSVARAFLDANGIDYATATPEAKMEPADVGERGARSAVMVECFE